jgi:cardiolipin synthase
MNYFVQVQFIRYRMFNRYILERCLCQFKSRVYCIKNYDICNKNLELKQQQARFIKDLKQSKKKEEIIERENIWTIPNFICIGRIITTPCIGYLIVSQDYQVN